MFKLTIRPVTKIAVRGRLDPGELELTEKLIEIRRVTKVVKGGKHMSFRALVVVGDGGGHVGAGIGKAREVPIAIRKGAAQARRDLISVAMSDTTIPHVIMAKFGAAKVLLKPALPGTGIIAGGGIRAVLEGAGIKDIVTKSLGGSSNQTNVVRATIIALANVRQPEEAVAQRKSVLSTGEGN